MIIFTAVNIRHFCQLWQNDRLKEHLWWGVSEGEFWSEQLWRGYIIIHTKHHLESFSGKITPHFDRSFKHVGTLLSGKLTLLKSKLIMDVGRLQLAYMCGCDFHGGDFHGGDFQAVAWGSCNLGGGDFKGLDFKALAVRNYQSLWLWFPWRWFTSQELKAVN